MLVLADIGSSRPWADPATIAINRMPMRVPTEVVGGSRWRRSLDGRWDFRLFDTPESVPQTAITSAVSARGWQRVVVPGNWTMQDTGDVPHYTNVQMPFHGPPPTLPGRNPTGVYRRSITVPAAWTRSRRVVLHIGGAESVHAVYVNGHFAGYGTDSRLASEYDITDLVRTGSNDLAVVVVRYSAQSYVEDQDQWWMAGLHREVFVESRARVGIENLRCDADLDVSTGAGSLRVTTTVAFREHAEKGWSVRAALETLDGTALAASDAITVPSTFAKPYVFAGHRAVWTAEIAAVSAWSAEHPHRYRVVAELVDPSGSVTETHTQLVGFRCVEVRDRQLLVNGQPIWIFGVNRHDHHPRRGKAVTTDDMRADLLAMRAHNITALRTSHYPNDPRLLDLCDEIGMYVIDEANIESHAYNTSLCDDERYRTTWLERGARMVQRDINHPSVILWSLGNESGYGTSHDALAGWIRRYDPSRPLHYEGAVLHDGWVDGGPLSTDVVCPMYPPIAAIEAYGCDGVGQRPLIMCEYSHAMGNSNGSLSDYWDVITSTPGLQGGFLWEWKDHGLEQTLPDGSTRLAYGGLFGDTPNDCNFVADGLMSADLEPHPAMREVTWVYRPVAVTAGKRTGFLTVSNRQSFSRLDGLASTWVLQVEGEPVETGIFEPGAIGPHASAQVALPCAVPGDGGAVHLSIRWSTRHDAPWARAGHLVAWDQVELRSGRPSRARRATPSNDTVPPAALEALFTQPPAINVWRAATDNDGFKLIPDLAARIGVGGSALTRWSEAGMDSIPADELVGCEVTRSIGDDGSVTYDYTVDVPDSLADLPRVGIMFQLPGRFRALRWFGRGPHENYPDRNSGAQLAVWVGGVDRSPYLVPQEFGLRTDTRWLEIADAKGDALRIDAVGAPFHWSATHHTPRDLFVAEHDSELVRRRELVVCIDTAHRGLGTASCGPDVLAKYRLPAGRYRWALRFSRTQTAKSAM